MKYRASPAYHRRQRISFGSIAMSGLLVNVLAKTNHNKRAKMLVLGRQMDPSLAAPAFYGSTSAAHRPYYKRVYSDYGMRLVHAKLLVRSTVN